METIELNNEKVNLKKGMFGWAVVHPVKNEDGTINWPNMLFGGYGNLFKLLLILFVILSLLYGVKEMMISCKDMAENPCKYTNLDCSILYNNNFVSWGDLNVTRETEAGI